MKIRDIVALITGTNRGVGLVFAQELLAAGARKLLTAARHPETITLDGVNRVHLDVTKSDSIAAAASECAGVSLLIKNNPKPQRPRPHRRHRGRSSLGIYRK